MVFNGVLAYLNHRVMCELMIYQLLPRLSSQLCVVCLFIRPLAISDIYSETIVPIEPFHVETPWDRRTNFCSNGPYHMTKKAVMPIYGKKFQTSSLEPKGR